MRRLLLFVGMVMALGSLPHAVMAVSIEEEIDLGKKIDVQIMKENRLYSDRAAQKEMEDYGEKLAKFVNRPKIPYHFKILKDNEFNAFSVPGGYVYFTDRLWSVLRKDERVGVIAHEITHVDQRHAIDALSKQQKRQTILAVLLAATKANNIWGNVAGIAEQMYTLKYSRGDEQQADYGAVNLCQKAGYNPAGILLSMYKIQRFENESGGAPPKIFSDHPPTQERLNYLKQLLTSKGIPLPSETIQTAEVPNRIGEVTSVDADTITLTSSQPIKTGDTVWVMREGWDSYYEKRSAVPAARAIATGTGRSVTAKVWMIPSTKNVQIAKGMGVYAPPMPTATKGDGTLNTSSLQEAMGHLSFESKPQPMERFLAVQPVWNKDNTQLINDNVGYVVVNNPASDTSYVALQRPKYSYAPIQRNSVLVKYVDPDQARWIGPVVSLGRSGATIEVKTSRKLDSAKVYDVLYPGWSKDDTYAKRTVGTAKLDSTDGKIVLKITKFSTDWSMDDVLNGFDVYEQKK